MEGKSLSDLRKFFKVKADTISDWLKRWNPKALRTLSDEARSGPPATPDAEKKSISEPYHIEILWRMIKHQWLTIQDYNSPATLKKAVIEIIKQFSTKYTITFS